MVRRFVLGHIPAQESIATQRIGVTLAMKIEGVSLRSGGSIFLFISPFIRSHDVDLRAWKVEVGRAFQKMIEKCEMKSLNVVHGVCRKFEVAELRASSQEGLIVIPRTDQQILFVLGRRMGAHVAPVKEGARLIAIEPARHGQGRDVELFEILCRKHDALPISIQCVMLKKFMVEPHIWPAEGFIHRGQRSMFVDLLHVDAHRIR